ncbi:MAG: dethiobiotin synthase [Thermodesulfobacteriota bacterium]
MTSYCVVGTDTDVGKTHVASLLLDFLQGQGMAPGYLKLVSCGGEEEAPDCQVCQRENGLAADKVQAIYHFSLAASPHLAAEQQGQRVSAGRLADCLRQAMSLHDPLVVEGAGGLLVPLNRDLLLADFLAGQDLPLIIVARSGLGTINHTLLTVEAARKRGLPICGLIFSDEQGYGPDDLLVVDNMATIEALTGVAVLGRLARHDNLAEARRDFHPLGQRLLSQG